MQTRPGYFQLREQKVTTITHVSPEGHACIGGIQASDSSVDVDPTTVVKIFEAKLGVANAANQQLHQQLQFKDFELKTTQQTLQSAHHAFQETQNALHIVQQVSSHEIARLKAENQSLLARLSFFQQSAIPANVVHPVPPNQDPLEPPPLTL